MGTAHSDQGCARRRDATAADDPQRRCLVFALGTPWRAILRERRRSGDFFERWRSDVVAGARPTAATRDVHQVAASARRLRDGTRRRILMGTARAGRSWSSLARDAASRRMDATRAAHSCGGRARDRRRDRGRWHAPATFVSSCRLRRRVPLRRASRKLPHAEFGEARARFDTMRRLPSPRRSTWRASQRAPPASGSKVTPTTEARDEQPDTCGPHSGPPTHWRTSQCPCSATGGESSVGSPR